MRKNSRFNRFVSAMLALIMVVGLIPANIIPTRAEDSAPSKMTYDGEYNAAIKRYKTSVDVWKKTGYKDGTVGIHLYSLKGGGITQPAFCMERGVNEPSEGSAMTLKWSKSSRDPSIVSYGWLLDWWYYHYYRGDFDDGQGSGGSGCWTF